MLFAIITTTLATCDILSEPDEKGNKVLHDMLILLGRLFKFKIFSHHFELEIAFDDRFVVFRLPGSIFLRVLFRESFFMNMLQYLGFS